MLALHDKLRDVHGVLSNAFSVLGNEEVNLHSLLLLLCNALELLEEANDSALNVRTELLEYLAAEIDGYCERQEEAIYKLVVSKSMVKRLITPKPGGKTVCSPQILEKELKKVFACIELNIKLLEKHTKSATN